jgi:hypothetical protein
MAKSPTSGDFPVPEETRPARNAVPALAVQVGIAMLFRPAYSRELDPIERPWKVANSCAFCGRYHPTFRNFQAAIPEVLDALPSTYSQQPVSWMTLILQQFDDVSLMAAQGISSGSSPPSTGIQFGKAPGG